VSSIYTFWPFSVVIYRGNRAEVGQTRLNCASLGQHIRPAPKVVFLNAGWKYAFQSELVLHFDALLGITY